MTMKPILRASLAALAFSAVGSAVQAAGGSFVCERSPTVEVAEMVGGSTAFQNIVNEYRVRWDAAEAQRQCEAFAAGRAYEITCFNGKRDWKAILASVPQDYFGKSNAQLAATFREEWQKGNGYKEAMSFCRSVGAIK